MKSLAFFLFVIPLVSADPLNCTLRNVVASSNLGARVDGETLQVNWMGEHGTSLRAAFAIDRATPVVRELAAGDAVLARNLTPEFTTVSGVRREAHGLDHEHRWDVFWDAPLTIPGHGENPGLPRKPEEIRRGVSSFETHGCEVRQEGARIEVSFPGLSLGIFSGRLQFTVYQGSNLVRVEAIAKTTEPSVAYKYTAGLRGFSTSELGRVTWRDAGGNTQKYAFGGTPNHDPVPLIARNRLAVAEGSAGSIAVFPPPHQFFFAREMEVNNGFVWYRKDAEGSLLARRAAGRQRGRLRAGVDRAGLRALQRAARHMAAHGGVFLSEPAANAGGHARGGPRTTRTATASCRLPATR